MTALDDTLMLLASVAPHAPWQWIAPVAAALFVACAWLDHDGATS